MLSLCALVLAACEEVGTGSGDGTRADATTGADTFSSSDASATSDDATTSTSDDATTTTTEDTTTTTTDDTTTTADTADVITDPNCPVIENLQPSAVYGVVYNDGDSSSSTLYHQRLTDPEDAPLAGVGLSVIDAQGVLQQTETCSTGEYAFDALADGVYVLQVADVEGFSISTSANHARRLQQAIAEGSVKVVAFGDSLPAYGPEPWFSERFSDRLRQFNVDVNEVNVAVPGSESAEWLPGSSYYAQRLAPQVADADVIVFSLGGNDLNNFVGDSGNISPDLLAQKVEELDPFLRQIEENITTIYETLRVAAPNADIVWILYPNYARSTEWKDMAGEYAPLAEYILRNKISDVRNNLGNVPGLLIMDIFNATSGVDLDPLLIDPLHLSEAGHQLFADELFLTLGGLRVEGGALIDIPERWFGFMAP